MSLSVLLLIYMTPPEAVNPFLLCTTPSMAVFEYDRETDPWVDCQVDT